MRCWRPFISTDLFADGFAVTLGIELGCAVCTNAHGSGQPPPRSRLSSSPEEGQPHWIWDAATAACSPWLRKIIRLIPTP